MSEFLKRIDKFLALGKDMGKDAALIATRSNYFYFTGFKGSAGYLLFNFSQGEAELFVDGRYEEEASRTLQGLGKVKVRLLDWKGSLIDQLTEAIASKGLRSLALDDELPHSSFLRIKGKLEERGVKVDELKGAVWKLRRRKSEEEIRKVKEALKFTEGLIRKIVEILERKLSQGEEVSELDITGFFVGESYAKDMRPSFDPIVAFGEGSSMPHYKPRGRKLSSGDIVLLDLGNTYEGYSSDITRTFSFSPSEEQEKVFSVLLEAQREAIEMVKPGVKVSDLEKRVREILREHDLDKYFIHALGHGVGIDVHEPPRVSSTGEDVLEVGEVITIEPGVYIPGKWGIRVENMVVVREDGFQVLNSLPVSFKPEDYF